MKRNEESALLIAQLLGDDIGKVTKAMAHIWGLLAVNYDLGINPLSSLRGVFPEFVWSYARTERTPHEVSQDILLSDPIDLARESHLMWDLGGGVVFAKVKAGHAKKFSFNAYWVLATYDWCSPHFAEYKHLCVRTEHDGIRLSSEAAKHVIAACRFV